MEHTAKLNYLKITPRKVRLIANTLKGLTVQEAEAQLLLRVQRSAPALLKLLRSAISNAKNMKMDASKLVVSEILVNKGPVLKRSLPRAMGRATPILKRMSHVVLVLKESEKPVKANRFVINPPAKKSSAPKKDRVKPKTEEVKNEKPKEKSSFFKRMFQRKSV